MRSRAIPTFVFVVLAFAGLLGQSTASAIETGQIDDFENGTTQGWIEGAGITTPNPNPPTNVASGGPDGAGDNYLQNISAGGIGPGSRLVQFNMTQWTGDYLAAGISEILVQVKVFAGPALNLRVGFRAADETALRAGHISTVGVAVPADGLWHTVVFPISSSDLTSDFANRTYNQTMSNVGTFRIMHASTVTATW